MTILVTGALGFIGSNLTINLLQQGHKVIGFDNFANISINPTDRIKAQAGKNWENFKFYRCDVRDLTQMLSICANESIDAIVHLAAIGSVPRSFDSPIATVHTNEMGFVSVCELAMNLNVKRLVFASSSSVYGDSNSQIRKEGEEGRPLSPYALSKLMNEAFANIWLRAAGINFVGLRFFNVYGPGQLPDSVYSAVIPKFINEKNPQVYGDGKTIRDFTYVGDVCLAIRAALIATQTKSAIVNVGTGIGTSLNHLLDLLQKREVATYNKPRIGDVKYSVADLLKCANEIGFVAMTKIDDGMKKTIAYYRPKEEVSNREG